MRACFEFEDGRCLQRLLESPYKGGSLFAAELLADNEIVLAACGAMHEQSPVDVVA